MANQGGSHEQHVKSGQQGHKSAPSKSATTNQASSARETKATSGKQGGDPEQHVKAGQQSHKKSH